MASVAQFTILKLKPGTAVEEAGTPAYDALQDVIASLKEGDGNQGVFFGRQIENPDFAVLASLWPSLAAAQSFSPDSTPQLSSLALSAETRVVELSPADSSAAVFSAPVTEVATAFGAEAGYLENTGKFLDVLHNENLQGYHGRLLGDVTGEISKEEGGEKGAGVMLFIGWDSVEAHQAAKECGALLSNFHLIRQGRKEMVMWHVAFKAV